MKSRLVTFISQIALTLLALAPAASAQELEPRAYSPSPIGTNFLALGYGYTSGDVLLDPALPLTDVEAKIHALAPAFSRTFGLCGWAASIAAFLPFVRGNVEGAVNEASREVTRTGIGDARVRISTNIIGGAALTPQEFKTQRPNTVVGTSLVVVAPTGEYKSKHLINIGSNRWAFKPEIGASHIIGDWFADASAGVWIFEDNSKFFGGVRREQDPLASFQAHFGYTFRPGLWLAADATYYTGGETTVAGIRNDDLLSNSRYGATLAIPISESLALKLSGSKGFTTRIGSDFTTVAAALQYRWFDD